MTTRNEVDKNLFKEFLEVFPSGSPSADLLENIDFLGYFNLHQLGNIATIDNDWNCAERSFLNPELDLLREDFWTKCHDFLHLIVKTSSRTDLGFQRHY